MVQHRYRLMQRYLDGLPAAENAYPQCSMKAAFVNLTRERTPFVATPDMPDWLKAFIDARWPATEWVPLVQCNAWVLAMIDGLWGGSVERYLRFNYETNLDYAKSPMFKLLYMMISPGFLMRHVPLAFRRGIRGPGFTVLRSEPGLATVQIAFPHGLYDEVIAQGWTAAFRAMLEATGTNDVQVVLAKHSPMLATYDATWKV